MTLADRIVIMETGAIQQIGTPDEIYSDPANTFAAGFIGSPPINLSAGHVQDGIFRAPGIEIGGRSPARRGAATSPWASARKTAGSWRKAEPCGDPFSASSRRESSPISRCSAATGSWK